MLSKDSYSPASLEYQVFWYPVRNNGLQGLDFGLGVRPFLEGDDTVRNFSALRMESTEIRFGGMILLSMRFQPVEELLFRVDFANGGALGYQSIRQSMYSGEILPESIASYSSVLSDLSIQAVWRFAGDWGVRAGFRYAERVDIKAYNLFTSGYSVTLGIFYKLGAGHEK